MSSSALVSLANGAKKDHCNENHGESGDGHYYRQERTRPLEQDWKCHGAVSFEQTGGLTLELSGRCRVSHDSTAARAVVRSNELSGATSDFIIALAQELDEAEPVTEWICHERKLAPFV